MRESAPKHTLGQWAWRSFVTTTLRPLLIVEVVLLTAYLGMSLYTHRRTSDTLYTQSRAQLTERVRAEAATLGARLRGVELLVGLLASQSRRALDLPAPTSPPPHGYRTREDGSYVSATMSPERSSLFYSGAHPVGPAERDKAHRTERIDDILLHLVATEPLAVQAYLNTFDSLNRIYPPIATDQLPAKMDIPSFNFYYLADEAHNPEREVVWTETYLDPAGAGWITSAIAPVYRGDTLEGVVGIDITTQQMIDGVLDLDLPWGGHPLLLSASGALLAASPDATAELGLAALPTAESSPPVTQEAHDLSARPELAQLAAQLDSSPAGIAALSLEGRRLTSWSRVDGTDWTLLFVIPEAAVYAPADQARADALRLGVGLVLGIVIFYVLYLLTLYRRSLRTVAQISAPLEAIRAATAEIAAGRYRQPPVHAQIAELDQTARAVIEMGARLSEKVDALVHKESALQAAQTLAAAERGARLAKTRFLANISHEIRTPMNGVLGLLELMEADATAAQRTSLSAARTSGASLLRLIDDLLDTAKLELGKMTLEQRPLDLHALAGGVVQLFSAQAAGKDIALRCTIAPDVPTHIRGDALRLRQILTNLVSNALKFTDRGAVSLTIATDASGQISFSVTDTGIGISADRIALILEPFRQADLSTTRRFGGTGLGLTISAGLIAEMGGTLRVESTLGEGSCFCFTLPLEACAPQPLDAPAPASPGRALRILIAEDNPINQMVIEQMLERLGHGCTVTADGEEALARFAPGAFDVGIFDVHMPQRDGLSLTRAIRSQEAAAGAAPLPILALTASVMAEELAACRDAGMDRHLTKPVTLSALAEALRALASPSRARSGSSG